MKGRERGLCERDMEEERHKLLEERIDEMQKDEEDREKPVPEEEEEELGKVYKVEASMTFCCGDSKARGHDSGWGCSSVERSIIVVVVGGGGGGGARIGGIGGCDNCWE
ncbi:Hypothetical predicted protein [Octopus vulgaris]|uniref:Uncharacterized protein n=1 Tax=Octopus vulgaris TaxID=6645 RepID=A0AA36FAM1_OCTVU|nr:Hypothetical predicted protein [Octopus vulgaris]